MIHSIPPASVRYCELDLAGTERLQERGEAPPALRRQSDAKRALVELRDATVYRRDGGP